jgi:hypothetical protein
MSSFGVDTIANPTTLAGKIAAASITYKAPKDNDDPNNGDSGQVTFHGLYLSRNLNKATCDALFAAGIDVFSIWESYPAANTIEKAREVARAYYNTAQGTRDGQRAVAAANTALQPSTAAIYFTIDTDPYLIGNEAATKKAICDYFRAVKEAVGGAYPIGCYGPAPSLGWLVDAGLIDYLWQVSASWGYTGNQKTYPDAHMYQYKGNTALPGVAGGVVFDYNYSPGGDVGGWGLQYSDGTGPGANGQEGSSQEGEEEEEEEEGKEGEEGEEGEEGNEGNEGEEGEEEGEEGSEE